MTMTDFLITIPRGKVSIEMGWLPSFFRVITLIFILLYISCVSASEDVVLKKYIYGLRQYSQIEGQKYLPPVIESLPYTDVKENDEEARIYPYYDMGDNESKVERDKHQVDIHLAVQQKNSDVLAMVSFYNRGQQNYFLYKNRLSLKDSFTPLCSHTFSIASEGISLVYLGWKCEFEGEDTDWVAIPAGKKFSYTVSLNDVYLFPPGKRRYNIGSLKFRMATDTYFYEERIYRYLFSIANWKYYPCKNKRYNSLRRIVDICEKENPWRDNTIESFMYAFNYDGHAPNSYFEARSNQVVIEIDGDKITSPYDKDTTRFSN
ncbi:hypothetical protein [Buttiauxella sp.]|uniref:hypothetical protein n=1 Tax=Buttiauxella sp. TaxID=1972222 RepID=UPI003C7137EE